MESKHEDKNVNENEYYDVTFPQIIPILNIIIVGIILSLTVLYLEIKFKPKITPTRHLRRKYYLSLKVLK